MQLDTIVGLWSDVAWTLGMLKVSNLVRIGEPLPEVNLYLADRYGRLARCYGRKGKKEKERVMDNKATYYYRMGGGEPPPAVAVAMQRPRPPIFTRAVSQKPDHNG